jgi:molecular chaperone HtpG
LRVRSGNIQVGDDRLFEDLFPEPRFNAWSVGEVHVVDQRIMPNGRRDHFEQNVHFHNLLTHLVLPARDIARRCRTSSVHRKWVRDFELREHALRDRVGIIKQGAVGRTERHRLGEEIRETLVALDQIVNRGALPIDTAQDLRKRLEKVQRESNRILQSPAMPSALMALPGPKRRAYEHVIGLIYECSPNQAAAKLLVDRILARLK